MTDRLDDAAPASNGISRRTLAKGAAWAVPAVLLAAPAPALAASLRKDPGINGWVLNSTSGGNRCRYDLEVNSNPGSGAVPTPDGAPFGLYLYDTEPTDVITNAKITYWIIGDQTASVTTLAGHSSCWSYTGRGTPQAKSDGLTYTPYHFEYTCPIDAAVTSTQPDGEERVWLGHFRVNFAFTQPSSLCNNVTYWTQRSIDIDINDGNGAQTLTFERRNGTLGPATNSMMRSQSLADETDLPAADGQVTAS